MRGQFVRSLCLVCSALLLVSLFSSCRAEENLPAPAPVTLKVFMPQFDGTIDDAPLVAEKLNAYIEPLIGARAEISFIPTSYLSSIESYSQTVTQKLSSGDQVDIAFCQSFSTLSGWVKQGLLCPLGDLMQSHGAGIEDALTEEYLRMGDFDGQTYALVTNRHMASYLALLYRADIAKQYGIDMESVKTIDDLDSIFAQVKEKCPDITPVAVVREKNWDALGNSYGVLMDYGQNTTVVNLYETEEYERKARRVYQWRQKGYVLDTMSDYGENSYYFRSGEVFSSFAGARPGYDTQEVRTIGFDMGIVQLGVPYSCTSDVKANFYTIPKSSANPEKAMELLRLMYTDPVVANLLIYGIEGKHYVYADKAQDIITYPEGIDAQNSGYVHFRTWSFASQFISHIWEGNPPDFWEQMQAYNRGALRSKARGFVFSGQNVQDEIVRCNAVTDKYLYGLDNGYLDPEETLPEFRAALKEAGIDTIIAEKQKQLDAWLGTGEAP